MSDTISGGTLTRNDMLRDSNQLEAAQIILEAANERVHNIKRLADGKVQEFDEPFLAVEEIRMQVAVLEVYLERLGQAIVNLGGEAHAA